MYRVSPFVRHFARALVLGVTAATVWVNLDPSGYYDFIEWRLYDLRLPDWMAVGGSSITPARLTSDLLMAFFMFFLGKELWEAATLERGALSGRRAVLPLLGIVGACLGAVLIWILTGSLIEVAEEASFAVGWQLPLGGDVVLAYVLGLRVFGSRHPALHLLLLVTIACDFVGLLVLGLTFPSGGLLQLSWLALPLLASGLVWGLFGRKPGEALGTASLWPYAVAGGLSYIGVAAAGLPPALGFLPVIPAIPHAARAFGFFAEAETYLHDPLNRLAHLFVRPLAVVLFLFGLTRGGIDLLAFAPTTLTTLAAFWLGKPLGFLLGVLLALRLLGATVPQGISRGDLARVALLLGIGFTVPVLALDTSLPGGGMAEAARLGLAFSLGAGGLALLFRHPRRHKRTGS